MKKKIYARRGLIPLACYLAALLIWLGACTGQLVQDKLAQADGRMTQVTLTAANKEFGMVDVLYTGEDGKLVCLSADPQLWWENYLDVPIRTVTMQASYSRNPMEISLYYELEGQTEISRDQHIYAQDNGDGTYTFTLPRTDVTVLRLDICSTACVVRDFSLTLNAPRPFWQYYVPTAWQAFRLILYPGLGASLAHMLIAAGQNLLAWRKSRAAVRPDSQHPGTQD